MRLQRAIGIAVVGLLSCVCAGACSSFPDRGAPPDGGEDGTTSDGPAAEGSPDSAPEATATDSGVDAAHDGAVEAAGGDPVVQISAGLAAACAITQSGALYCWGLNADGEVGDGTTTARSAPVHVNQDSTGGALGPVAQVSAGWQHTCAQMRDNTVYCWGNDDTGQLGDGILLPTADAGVKDQHRPQKVPGVTGTAVYSGAYQVCVPTAGNFVCWGGNSYGELGHAPGTLGDSTVNVGLFPNQFGNSTPHGGVQVPGSTTASFGFLFGCANDPPRQRDWCWGSNISGQLGNATDAGQYGVNPNPVFVSVGGGGTLGSYRELAAAAEHACALDGQGNLSCWGSSGSGQLGPGIGVVTGFQQYAVSTMTNVSHVAAGGYSTCVVDGSQHVQCFGDNGQWQLGHDPTTDPFSSCHDNNAPCNANPTVVMVGGSALGPAKAISVGVDYACALKTDGTVWCWGAGPPGWQDGGTSYLPRQVPGLP
jgi:alpha-tubulin suppressor-like RCC1 family protein